MSYCYNNTSATVTNLSVPNQYHTFTRSLWGVPENHLEGNRLQSSQLTVGFKVHQLVELNFSIPKLTNQIFFYNNYLISRILFIKKNNKNNNYSP